MIIIVEGKPVPKQSFRATKYGGYTDPKVKRYANEVRASYYEQIKPREKIYGIFSVDIGFFFEVPKSIDGRRLKKGEREQMLAEMQRPTSRIDLDNLAKNILDALNGLAYVDDRFCVDLRLSKYYSASNYAMIEIKELK